MILRAWFLMLWAVACVLGTGPVVPPGVAEFRARLDKPGGLAAELGLFLRERGQSTGSAAEVGEEIAFCAGRTVEELDRQIAEASEAARKRAEAATGKRSSTDPEADGIARREEAAALAELAVLRMGAGEKKGALTALRSRMEVLAPVATPEEWLLASLDIVRALGETEDNEAAEKLLALAKKLVGKDGPLADSAPSKARILASEAWANRTNKLNSPTAWREATEAAEKALAAALGAHHPETLACLAELASIPTESGGDGEKKVSVLSRLVAGREATLGAEHPLTLQAVQALGMAFSSAGDATGAYPHLRRAYEGWERGAGIARANRLLAAGRVALQERTRADHALAQATYERLVEASTKVHGAEARQTLGYRNDLAIVLSNRGDFAQAEKVCREVRDIRMRLFGEGDATTLSSMNNLGVYVRNLGRYREAEQLFTEALAARVKAQGEDHSEALRTKSNIASLRLELGDIPQAEKLIRLVYEKRREKLGPAHADTLGTQHDIARVLLEKGDFATAEKLANEVVEARQKTEKPDHPTTVGAMNLLAEVWTAKGEHARALEVFHRSVSTMETRYGKDDPASIWSVRDLGEALLEAGDVEGAVPALQRCMEHYEKRLGREHPIAVSVAGELAQALVAKGDYATAEPMLRRALEQGATLFDAGHPFVARMAFSLAELLGKTGRAAEGLPLAEKAAAIAAKKLPENQRIRKRYDALVAELRGK